MTESQLALLEKFHIVKILPYLKHQQEIRKLLIEQLEHLGVDEYEDLPEVTVEDISPPLPIIKARRLITHWRKGD